MDEETLKAVQSEIESLNSELSTKLQKIADLEGRIKTLEQDGEGSADLKQRVADISSEVATISDQIDEQKSQLTDRQDEIEAKMQEGRFGGAAAESPRHMVKSAMTEAGINSDFSGKKRVQLSAKAITNLDASGGPLLQGQERPGIQRPGEETLTVLDMVPSIPTSRSSITYRRELAVTNNADYQGGQGTRKPESDFTFEQATENVETLAHFTKIAKQMLDDVEGLSAYIDTRLLYLLRHKASGEVLNGAGTAGTLNGLNTQATAYDPADEADVTNPTQIDRLRLAMAQVAASLFPPTGHVLNPLDWAKIELRKDSSNQYIFTQPQSTSGPRMWGLPVSSTYQQAENTFTVGSFTPGAVQLWVREQASVLMSSENEADFVENLVTLLAEMRAALTVYRPSSFVTGDLVDPAV